jgi:hypothetical protein
MAADGSSDAMQLANSSNDSRTTFTKAWSELQIQQQQRWNLQLQCSFPDKFKINNPFLIPRNVESTR